MRVTMTKTARRERRRPPAGCAAGAAHPLAEAVAAGAAGAGAGVRLHRGAEPAPPARSAPARRRWLILGILVAAQFMVVLDAAIVNVALPSIQRSLGFSEGGLAWVVDAYIVVFGGFLLLGGRAADLFGRRRTFLAGLAVFSLASLACGLATASAELVAFRAVQGLGAAILSPAALSIVTTTFTEPGERNTALGIWGAVAGAAAAAGVLAGGILTAWAGWRWVFFVNVPVGAALALAWPLLAADRRLARRPRLDLPGAVLVTGGICVLVYAFFQASQHGWASPATAGLLAAAAAVLAGFVARERRCAEPLLPLDVFRMRSLSGANAVNLLLGAVLFSTFFFLTLYLQRVLGYGPLRAGLAMLPLCAAQVLAAWLAGQLAGRLGHRPPLIAGLLLMAGSLLWFTQLTPHSHYAPSVLVPAVLFGAGLSTAIVMTYIASQDGVPGRLAGMASGLINTTLNVGGALGLAVLGAIATTRTHAALAHAAGHTHGAAATVLPRALTAGFQLGWTAATAIALLGAVLAFAVLPGRVAGRQAQPGAGRPSP